MRASLIARWRNLSRRGKLWLVLGTVAVLACVVAAVVYMATGDGFSLDAEHPEYSYVAVFALIALDAVIPIFPGETTLNAAATLAAQGVLDLVPIIVMGALGAIVGDSALFWIARKSAHRVEDKVERAKADPRVRQALELLRSSAPVLIIGGRYLPGMRFVVNAMMGLSDIRYRRFLLWSVISGILWSTYTCVLAYKIGLALGEYPFASFIISGLVSTVALAVVFLTVRRHRRRAAATAGAEVVR